MGNERGRYEMGALARIAIALGKKAWPVVRGVLVGLGVLEAAGTVAGNGEGGEPGGIAADLRAAIVGAAMLLVAGVALVGLWLWWASRPAGRRR